MKLTFSDRIFQRFATRRTVVFLLFCAFLVTGCKDDQLLGIELQPTGEFDPVQFIDTFTVQSFTLKGQAQRSDEAQSYIGKLQSDFFGTAESALLLNFSIQVSEMLDPPTGFTVDSVVLHLRPIYSYGQYTDPVPVDVYELGEQLYRDSAYTSDFSPPLNTAVIGRHVLALNHEINVKDSITVQGTREPFQFRIPIDQSIGEKLLQGMGNSTGYKNTESLQAYFKGVAIRVQENMDPSLTGAMYGFDLTSGESGLRVYASKNDTQEVVKYSITSQTARINQFKVNHSGSTVEEYIAQGAAKQDLVFVQGMSGARAEIRIPYLDEFGAKSPFIAVSKATLTFQISDQQPSIFPNGPRLFLLDLEEDNVESLTLDYIYDSGRYGGRLDEASKSYTFDVTRHVQKVLNEAQKGNDINRGLRLHAQVPAINGNDVSQNVLKGSGDIVLKLFYTDLND